MTFLLRRPMARLCRLQTKILPIVFRCSHDDYKPDYYSVLGVPKTAETKQIKLAYFRMAKKYHPDNNQTDEARFMFQFIAEAYEVLTDDNKRKNYDTFGTAYSSMGGTSQGPQRPFGSQTYTSEELYNKIFGEASRAKRAEPVDEYNDQSCYGHESLHEFVADLTFEQACAGTKLHVPLRMKIICFKCQGSLSEMGYQGNICPYCEGTGIETERIGFVLTRRPCSYCHGTKIFIRYKCHECAGTGQTIMEFNQEVLIPPGCENGQLLKVQISEEFLKTRAPSQNDHFFLKVTYDRSNYFTKEGLDLFSEADISISQALLGGTLIVRGLMEDKLKVPLSDEGTPSHKTLVSPGQGIPRPDYSYSGNHFVKVGIKIPKKFSQKQIDIIRAFSLTEPLPENGLVDNGFEQEDGHKYRNNLINPSTVDRRFGLVEKTDKEKYKEDEEYLKDKMKETF